MSITLAFDVYGTLIDTNGIVLQLQEMIGPKEKEFSQTWRDKQLEYSFRRGLMQNYKKFSVCTSDALDYTCEYYKIPLSREQKQNLLENYHTLPAFKDVKTGLTALRANNFRMFAFSNGSADAVETLLVSACIREYFLGIVSVDDIKSFKPNPAVYSYFLRKSGASCCGAWLISSNPFDIIGAISAGMRAAWVRRSEEAIFDPWGIEPTLIVESLRELNEQIIRHHG
jgi:2-haloacid dehalogenase